MVQLEAGGGKAGPQADGVVELGPGDYVNIPAHVKHRVIETSTEPVTIWLAVHY